MRPFLEEAEYALADLYRWAWNWNHSEQIGTTATFRVEFLPESPVLSPIEEEELRKTRLQRYSGEVQLGTRTLAEVLAEDRGITLAAAQAELAQRDTDGGGAMNGAQVTALQGIAESAAAGRLSVESAVALITAGFPITEDQARRIVGQPMPADEPEGVQNG